MLVEISLHILPGGNGVRCMVKAHFWKMGIIVPTTLGSTSRQYASEMRSAPYSTW